MAVLKPPNSASLFTFRAAEWAVQINTGTVASPDWKWLLGISKFDPKFDPTMQDDSDINSGGYGSELVTAQKLNLEIEGKIKGEKSQSAIIPDPGTSFLRAKGQLVGYDNIVQLRYWRTDDIDEGFVAFFAAKYTDVGGGNADLQNFQATLSGRGKPEKINRPQAVAVNELQKIVVTDATGGTFTAAFLGQPTSGIAYNAAPAAVQTALLALSTVGAGNVTVTGVPGNYDVEFKGALAGTDIPPIAVNGGALTPSPAAKVGVQTTTQGAPVAA